MLSADAINAAQGAAGLFAIASNVLALWRSQDGQACSLGAVAYFVLSAGWSVYFCASLGQWLTAAVCSASVLLHAAWLGVVLRNRTLGAEREAEPSMHWAT